MNDRVKDRIRTRYTELTHEDFCQWLIEYLTCDINEKGWDNQRIEILRYVAEENMI